MDILKSKKFQAALVSLVVVIAAKLWDAKIEEETLLTIISPLLTYIAGQGLADIGKEKAKAEAKNPA